MTKYLIIEPSRYMHVPEEILKNPRLSVEAKFIYLHFLTLQKTVTLDAKKIINPYDLGEKELKKGLTELIECGYIVPEQADS